MAVYRLHLAHPGGGTTVGVDSIEDLAEAVAVEQLAHELNPVTPDGYAVAFRLTCPPRRATVADGHFYVRAAVSLPRSAGNANRPT